MAESWSPNIMNDLHLALPATIYRVGELEKKLEQLMLKIDSASNALGAQITQIKSCMVLKDSVPNEEGAIANIIVPEELAYSKGKKFKKGKTICRATANKKTEVVARRWALWKEQYNAGIPAAVIARAWGCDHSTILNARDMNWQNYKLKGSKS
jgi:hypothetical protein